MLRSRLPHLLLWENFLPVKERQQTLETDMLWLSKRMEKQLGIYLGRLFAVPEERWYHAPAIIIQDGPCSAQINSILVNTCEYLLTMIIVRCC